MGGRIKVKGKDRNISSAEVKNSTYSSGRLDLNDLLKRAKDEANYNRKTNLLIFSGTLAVAAVLLLIFTL